MGKKKLGRTEIVYKNAISSCPSLGGQRLCRVFAVADCTPVSSVDVVVLGLCTGGSVGINSGSAFITPWAVPELQGCPTASPQQEQLPGRAGGPGREGEVGEPSPEPSSAPKSGVGIPIFP